MRHRIFHSRDLRERLGTYALALDTDSYSLSTCYQWMLENEVLFEEPNGNGTRVYLSLTDLTPRIDDPATRRFYLRLRGELPMRRFVPIPGFNMATFRAFCTIAWEQWYNILINKIPSHHVRLAWLRLGGAKIGRNSTIWRTTEVLGMGNLRIGEDSSIGWHCQIDARCGLTIGDHVTIASYVVIIAGSHDMHAKEFWAVGTPIAIDDYAWIASRAIVVNGAHLGRGCAVTANTLVGKDVAPYKIVGGSAAKALGERPRDLDYKVRGRSLFNIFH
jgi:acetyltransferase-like isoleucine patch superfamily enzyme